MRYTRYRNDFDRESKYFNTHAKRDRGGGILSMREIPKITLELQTERFTMYIVRFSRFCRMTCVKGAHYDGSVFVALVFHNVMSGQFYCQIRWYHGVNSFVLFQGTKEFFCCSFLL